MKTFYEMEIIVGKRKVMSMAKYFEATVTRLYIRPGRKDRSCSSNSSIEKPVQDLLGQ